MVVAAAPQKTCQRLSTRVFRGQATHVLSQFQLTHRRGDVEIVAETNVSWDGFEQLFDRFNPDGLQHFTLFVGSVEQISHASPCFQKTGKMTHPDTVEPHLEL